jgi:hypothetical protein
MNNAKNPARTSAIIHVAGTLNVSSLIRLANNYPSVDFLGKRIQVPEKQQQMYSISPNK